MTASVGEQCDTPAAAALPAHAHRGLSEPQVTAQTVDFYHGIIAPDGEHLDALVDFARRHAARWVAVYDQECLAPQNAGQGHRLLGVYGHAKKTATGAQSHRSKKTQGVALQGLHFSRGSC
jgi:hypothetical protein